METKTNALGTVIDIGDGLSLLMRPPGSGNGGFPTSRIAKGLVLCCDRGELVEEGLGFGVPLLKYGGRDVFPGTARFAVRRTASESIITIDFELNLVKKLNRNGKKLVDATVYSVEDWLGRMHRAFPLLRRPGDWLFGKLRAKFDLTSVFENVTSAGTLRVLFTIPFDGTVIHVEADLSNVNRAGLTEIIIANEQGAGSFDEYRDSDGLMLKVGEIGTWDEVKAGRASLIDLRDGITFSLRKIDGVRLFRGREDEAGRLAWAGLIYVLNPELSAFSYDIALEKMR